jgi:hypothetical protein
MAIVALGMWMFWKGIDGPGAYWLIAGFLASVSATFRDTNALIFMPFIVGCLVRKQRKSVWLAAGGIAGSALWASANVIVFGRWFNRMNEVSGGLTLSNVIPALGPCALALLVMVPGGLIAGLAYRHKRNVELRVSIILYVAFYLLWWYSARESGLLKGAILGGRFYMPLVPVIAFAEGSVLQGLMIGRLSWLARLSPAAVMATALLAVAVHPVMAHFERPQRQLANAIYRHTTDNALVITNTLATKKYFDSTRGPRRTIDYEAVHAQDIRRVLADRVPVQLVFLYRSDSNFWLNRSAGYDRYIAALEDQFDVRGAGTFQTTRTDRLMIFNVVRAN